MADPGGQHPPHQPGAPHPPYGPQPQYPPYPQPYPPRPPHPGYPGYPGYPGGYGPPPVRQPWIVPAPPGVPYHRLARNAVHRWWRPLVGSLFIVGAGLAAVMVIGFAALMIEFVLTGEEPGQAGGSHILTDPTADIALQLILLATFLPAALGAAWLVQRRRPGTLSSVLGRLRPRWLLLCAGVAAGVLALQYGMGYALAEFFPVDEDPVRWAGWAEFLPAAALILLLVPFQSAAEEYVFRGWLLQGIAACTLETATGRAGRIRRAASAMFRTPWPAIVISSALFMLGHGYTGLGMVDIFLFGAVACWLAVRTGGLEASIALHATNNIVAFMIPAALGELDGALEQGAVAWQFVVADVLGVALYAVVVDRLVRRRGPATVSPSPPISAPGPASGMPATTAGWSAASGRNPDPDAR